MQLRIEPLKHVLQRTHLDLRLGRNAANPRPRSGARHLLVWLLGHAHDFPPERSATPNKLLRRRLIGRDEIPEFKGKAIISLNDHPDIRRCFEGFGMESLSVDYTVTVGNGANRAERKELIIYSWDREA